MWSVVGATEVDTRASLDALKEKDSVQDVVFSGCLPCDLAGTKAMSSYGSLPSLLFDNIKLNILLSAA